MRSAPGIARYLVYPRDHDPLEALSHFLHTFDDEAEVVEHPDESLCRTERGEVSEPGDRDAAWESR